MLSTYVLFDRIQAGDKVTVMAENDSPKVSPGKVYVQRTGIAKRRLGDDGGWIIATRHGEILASPHNVVFVKSKMHPQTDLQESLPMEPKDVIRNGAAYKLRESANDIEAVTATLDRSTTACGQCSAQRWNNRDEYQMAVELDAVVAKLRRFATKLGDPEADEQIEAQP